MKSPVQAAPALWPVLVCIVAMACFQSGAAIGKLLFPLVGAMGATTLRLTISALILAIVSRPWRGKAIDRAGLMVLLLYGVSIAGLNVFFYLAIRTIPIGVAVAVDFLGPLGVALYHSRRPVDVLWAVMAIGGVIALTPLGTGGAALDPVGLAYCFAAAASWAIYIMAGRSTGSALSGGRATALGMAIGALVVLPFGIGEAGLSLVSLAVLPLGLAVAILSSALPYNLEMFAMTRLPPSVFGVLMSLEPVLGAFFGWLVLGEHLTLRQGGAVMLVILASAGATVTSARTTPAPVV